MNGWAVPSTLCAVEIVCYSHPDALPEVASALFAPLEAGLDGLFGSAAWYRVVVAEAVPDGGVPVFALVLIDGIPAVLFALLREQGAWQSLTTPYSCLYRPLMRPDLTEGDVVRAGKALASLCRDGLRLEAIDPDWPGLAPLLRGLRAGGLVALRFEHFGNWHVPIPPLGWAGYLAGRDGALRETIRRRTARALQDPGISLELFRTGEDIERGIAAFEDVYRRSWKRPEPYPGFNAGFMRAAAGLGLLRLGVMWQDKRAIAAQYWVVVGSTAAVLKLAHDEAARSRSPGTVLTGWMIKGLLADGPVRELDFGRGDDPYKLGWTTSRRQRIGFVLANPLGHAGLVAILLHGLGRLRNGLKSLPVVRLTRGRRRGDDKSRNKGSKEAN